MTNRHVNEQQLLEDVARKRRESPLRPNSLVRALLRLAKFWFDRQQFESARSLLQEAREISVKHLGGQHILVAECLTRLALLESEIQNHSAAIVYLDRARKIIESKGDSHHSQLVVILNQAAEAMFADCRFTEALQQCTRALELLGGDIYRSSPAMTRTRNNLAALHVARGEYFLAARLLKLNAQIMRQDGSANDLAVATTLNNLAEVLRLQGKYSEAWPQAVRALWIRRRSLGRRHPLVAQSWANLAAIRADDGRYQAAESLMKRALSIRAERADSQPALYAGTLRSYAETLLAANRSYEAETIFRQAAEIYEKSFGPNDPQLALTLTCLGRLHIQCGQHGSAQQVLSRAVEIQEGRGDVRDAAVALTFNTYGKLHSARNNFEQAEIFFRRALRVQQIMFGCDHPDVADTHVLIGDATFAREDYAAAHAAYQQALEIRRRQLGTGHRSVAEAMHRIAKVLVAENQPQSAIQLCEEIRSCHGRTLQLDAGINADVHGTLADAYLALERFDDAERISQEEWACRAPHRAERPGESVPVLSRLTRIHLKRQNLPAARESARELVAMAEKLHGANHPNMLPTVAQLAEVLILGGDEDAAKVVERATKLCERKFGTEGDELPKFLERIANLFHESGQTHLADEYFTRASNLRDRHAHALFV